MAALVWPLPAPELSPVRFLNLIFHVDCHAVVHWNLPGNPVDLEQREGRVHRYKGHAVRKNVAAAFGEAVLGRNGSADVWAEVCERAREAAPDSDHGLVPYWLYPRPDRAFIERHIPHLPLSREERQLEALRRSLAVYRMVFGQPRQDDLMAYLLDRLMDAEIRELQPVLRIDLSPMHRRRLPALRIDLSASRCVTPYLCYTLFVYFELVGQLSQVAIIVRGPGLRRRVELQAAYGKGTWRKLKGVGLVRLRDGTMLRAELHWYEAHGIGRRRMKIKRFLDRP